jgi:hypothetical protein
VGRIGAGGVELLGYYAYGDVGGLFDPLGSSPIPTDWTHYGWGTLAWSKMCRLIKDVLLTLLKGMYRMLHCRPPKTMALFWIWRWDQIKVLAFRPNGTMKVFSGICNHSMRPHPWDAASHRLYQAGALVY